MSTLNIRLPGVYFYPPPRARARGLPPLDVAAFVGFAERGPLDTPVAIDDLNTYRAIFGGDLPLAREQGQRTIYANLPAAVATFFANGGRRCYVVRVAGKTASFTRLRVSGLISLHSETTSTGTGSSDERPTLATLNASSVGRWSQRLRLGARLQITPLPVSAFTLQDPPLTPPISQRLLWTTSGASEEIQKGDLLKLTFAGARQYLFAVEEIQSETETAAPTRTQLSSQRAWRIINAVQTIGARPVTEVKRLTPDGSEPLNITGTLTTQDNLFCLKLAGVDAPLLARGDVLRISFGGRASYLIPVTQISTDKMGQRTVSTRTLLRLPARRLLPVSPSSLLRVERLRFDLLLREGQERRPDISDLSLNRGSTRFWGDVVRMESSKLLRLNQLQSEATPGKRNGLEMPTALPGLEFAPTDDRAGFVSDEAQDAPVDDASQNRSELISLAGLLAPFDHEDRTYLPLEMLSILSEEDIQSPLADEVGEDGLEKFDQSLFVDEFLTSELNPQPASGEALMKEACDRLYVQGKRLRGLHSLFFIDEVALISIPDATHRAWHPSVPDETVPTPVILPPPDLSEFQECDGAALPSTTSPPLLLSPPELPQPSFLFPQLEEVETYDSTALLGIQQALVNLCQARRDMVSVLTLPLHFEKRDCVDWLKDLRQKLGLPTRSRLFTEAGYIADLSYVTVYHPWLLVAAETLAGRPLRAVPADGAICGMIAARERERQVWIAPANVPLAGVLGLTPSISASDLADLFDLQFNILRAAPRDFRTMSAHTLSDERIWLQISVRRLLILLRKAAVERGMDFVFESNNERLASGVRLMLQDLLREMFARGAFAGKTPEDSFVVTTDRSVNTPQSIEAGRFIVQIQVAPSQPMEFITVLLTRVGEDLLQATEA
jgi:Phage tail sheath C-terminal domain